MKRRKTNVPLQALGWLMCLCGFGLIAISVIILFPFSWQESQEPYDSPFTLFIRFNGLFLGSILCIVGCRVLYRFSPRSIRMALTTYTYFLYSKIKLPDRTSSKSEWVLTLGIVAAYVLYRLAAKYYPAFHFEGPAAVDPSSMSAVPAKP